MDLLPSRINIDAESVEQGLAKLVLTLIEFIRRLLEAQALRRMEGTDLTPQQIEELGLALMKLEARMKEMKAAVRLVRRRSQYRSRSSRPVDVKIIGIEETEMESNCRLNDQV